MAHYVVAAVDESVPGPRDVVGVAWREIGVYNVDRAFSALITRCRAWANR